MKEKILLLLTDDEIILSKGSSQQTYSFTDSIASIQSKLKNVLSFTPKTPLFLLIDRNHQDVREEQLPSLMPWDRLRFLSHKKEGWRSQGEFYGYRFFTQEGKSFLQWINITQNDSLLSWLSWIKSLPNPLYGVSFVFLEAGKFLKKHGSPTSDYHMLIYKVSSYRTRYVIFKGKRLLLARPLSGEEDLRTSLHFLSRVHPDIYEKLQVLTLINDVLLTFPHIITLPDPQAFMNFLTFRKGETLSLNIRSSSQNSWIRRGKGFILIASLLMIGITIYQYITYRREIQDLLSKIDTLRGQINHRKTFLEKKDLILLRSGLDHYNNLKTQIRDPLKTLAILSSVLEKHNLHLDSLIWGYEQTLELEISLFMRNHKEDPLIDQFKSLLSSLREAFPHGDLHVIEGPFKSSPHETYTHPTELSLPMARIRIVLS